MTATKILIADDHTLFINGLQLLLEDEGSIEVVGIANDGRELIEILKTMTPDVILLDINMPRMNGLDALREVKAVKPATHIIILSTYSEDHLIEKAKLNGANGYLLKNSSKEDLIKIIQLVVKGQTCFPYQASSRASLPFPADQQFIRQFNLTKRELEIIQFLKNGLTNQQIAEAVFLSVYTVETHRKNIMQKLSLKSPAELMKFIIQNNL